MDLDVQQLKEKTHLLLQREREVLELRMKHERLAVWLRLTQSLPAIFADPSLSIGDRYMRLRKALLDGLKLQRVLFFEIEFDGALLRPLAPAGAVRPLDPEVLATIRAEPYGTVNDVQSPGGAALSEAFGLARLIWSRIDAKGSPPVILAAGFEQAKADCYPAFDASEAANLRNAAQHIEGLVGNATLVAQIQQEHERLKQAHALLQSRDAELRAMAGDLRTANESLEQRVVERTVQLERRSRDMRLVLDNVLMALVTIDPAGRLAEERSAKVDQWFGAYQGTPSFVEYIAAADPEFATWFALGHEALLDGFLPLELCLDQLPKRLRSKQRSYRCSFRPIGGADDISLLIMIEDVTEQLRLEQEEAEQSEILALCEGLTRDRAGFLTFFEEADRLVREITEGSVDPAVRKRHLHTLKGNAAMMGVNVVADLCHRTEELVLGASSIEGGMGQLQQRWSAIQRTMEPMLGDRGKDIVEIPSSALKQLCQEIDRGLSRTEIQQRLRHFTFEPIDRPLARLTRHAKALADRLGKPNLAVAVESDDLWVDPRRFGNLWAALVHVVRNAVDHGIEPPAERIGQGKPPEGRMKLRASHTAGELTIEIEDDGRGIDWERVTELAAERGLPLASEADLVRALLSDEFSTRKTVTATSGRGIGLSAVYHEVESLGGGVSIESQSGGGTCCRMTLPLRPTTGVPDKCS